MSVSQYLQGSWWGLPCMVRFSVRMAIMVTLHIRYVFTQEEYPNVALDYTRGRVLASVAVFAPISTQRSS
jgi:hypothetical protein